MTSARQILDHRVIAERYFFPRRAPLPAPEIVSTRGVDLHCHRARARTDDAPVLCHFHGNGEVVADWAADFCDALTAEDVHVFLAEYAGYGGSTGTPALASMLDDALALSDAAGPASRQVVYGRSVGSIYALHVAAHRPVAGLIIESGIADVHQRLALRLDPSELGVSDDEFRAATSALLDHRAKLSAFGGPTLVLHAEADHLVGVQHARQLAEWAEDRAELCIFGRGDHNTIHAYNGAEIVSRVAHFAQQAVGLSSS